MRVLGTLALLLSTVTARGEENATIYDGDWKPMATLDPSVQHIPLNEAQRLLRPPPSQIPDSFNMFVGSSVFRDGYRCGKTLFTALKRAIHPERLHFGVLEQIYEGDPTCLEEYCKMAQAEWPDYGACRYKDQIKIDTRSAADSAGCTTARHLQQKLIQNEEFCLQVDGHSIFTNKWDENLLAEWTRIDNEMAVISVYPHHIHDGFVAENGDNNIPTTLPHLCTTIKGGNGLTRIVGASMIGGSKFPQLEALWGGGLSFSKCHAERNVPIDPHTPWLWDGEEFLRSADYWTHGYDLYSPSELGNVLYHNYSSKPASFWASPIDPVKKELDTEMAQNRVRLRIGFPFKGNVDTFELEKYGFGEARTFQQYLKFANVSLEGDMNATNSCGQLHWVPYTNATVVEEIVGNGWKQEDPEDDEGNVAEPTPLQQLPVEKGEVEEEDLEIQRAAQRVAEAHVQNGADIGEESVEKTMAQLRQKVASPMAQNASNAPAWVFLMVVVSALFVTLSNDSNSRAIRRRCRLSTSHTSIE
ncbi:hypothetical protein BBJ28_00014265 [Nothophytophthora sp. Chile5]|nr:hypothetical protein BBJ28_00014265 [Nothophytophthora sp. Chile5]